MHELLHRLIDRIAPSDGRIDDDLERRVSRNRWIRERARLVAEEAQAVHQEMQRHPSFPVADALRAGPRDGR